MVRISRIETSLCALITPISHNIFIHCSSWAYAAVAVNKSINLALVTNFRQREKTAVNNPIAIKRTKSDSMEYKTTMEAMGSREARMTPMRDVRRARPV